MNSLFDERELSCQRYRKAPCVRAQNDGIELASQPTGQLSLTVKPPPINVQPCLFDVRPTGPLETPASARTHYGRTVELAVEALLNLVDIPNSGNYDVVYDAHGRGTYCEIKSVIRSGAIPVYEWRRKKDSLVAVPVVYVVALHKARGAETHEQIWELMSATLTEILVLPAWKIDKIAPRFKRRQLVEADPDSRMGYKRKGYCEGYRNVPVCGLRKLNFREPVPRKATVYDFEFNAQVRTHKTLNGQWEALKPNT